MQASAIEFRLRMPINAVIIILGFWAPWIELWHVGVRISLVEWLALQMSRTGAVSFSAATTLLVVIAAAFGALAVLLRVSGTAYLGASTVNSVNMHAGKVMADGPYRYLRNPLYIGLWCMVVAMAFLMPVTGAISAIVLITIFMIRLALAEEPFLLAKIGEAYDAYRRAVPRFIPRLRGSPGRAGAKPHWIRAALAELTPIGVLVAIVVYSRNYELALAGRVILIFFGASLVVRAFMPSVVVNAEPAK